MELKVIPLLDNYETTLAQEWNWQVWKMKVDDLPTIPVDWNWKFEWWFTTFVIVNPDKLNSQLAEIDWYNSADKTLNVIKVELQKWLNTNYNHTFHTQKSIVRISNNFAFWKKVEEVINSKQDYWIWTVDNGKDYFINVKWWILKLKDKDNSEITLSDIATKTGQNNKVAVNDTDTPWFLSEKIWKWFKINDHNWKPKVDIDYDTMNFDFDIQDTFYNWDYFVLANKKRIWVFQNNASFDEVEKLDNTHKTITPNTLWHLFKNLNMTQIAAAANSVRFEDNTEFTGRVDYPEQTQVVKKFIIKIDWKIRLKFNFKHWYKNENFDIYEIKYFIFVNNKEVDSRIFDFSNYPERQIRWSNDDFNKAPYMEQVFDLDVKALDIIEIKVGKYIRTKFNSFRVCFDYEYFRPWNFID